MTFGELNGWHPHLHLALLTVEPWSVSVLAEFRSTLFDSWFAACERAGLPLPSRSAVCTPSVRRARRLVST